MYVNQIDNIIDQILDQLYLDGLSNDETFKTITLGNKINYVEYRDKINDFIRNFMKTLDVNAIQKMINNKENLTRIMDIIKRYVAYYYFLSIAYYYKGSIKDFRNNLIQYSKLQENSTYVIKNFFDTENNYQLINFFKIIKDVSKIITMTDLNKKTLNPLDVKDAINFLNDLGKDYVDEYLLMIVKEGEDNMVEINVHNLIKTIVFREIYRNQEQTMVFEILNDIEEENQEHIYIDIVVPGDENVDFENFRQIFLGETNTDVVAMDLFDLVNESARIIAIPTAELKNNNLLEFSFVTPIVDDFLRYHKDNEKMDAEGDNAFKIPLVSGNNSKNIQMALLYQQRKKKENTRAQIIVNKIDTISDYYSDNVKNNPDLAKDIRKYFVGPLSSRKAVMHNYLDEVHVMNKIRLQGKKVIEDNEYYLELINTISNAYFNFKDFQKYGVSLNITPEKPIDMIRYSNIEYQTQMKHLDIDMHTAIADDTINLVGLALGPFINGPIQCIKKENLIDIRNTKISYIKDGKVKTAKTENGYKAFVKIIKHFYINTIAVKTSPLEIYNNFDEIQTLNADIFDKVIYWTYDNNKDIFEMNTYENIKSNNLQETIRFMNSNIYDRIIKFLGDKLIKLIDEHKNMHIFELEKMVQMYSQINRLFLKQDAKRELVINDYLRKIGGSPTHILPITEADREEMPDYIPIQDLSTFRIKIDLINPLNPQKYHKIEAYSSSEKEAATSATTIIPDSKCQHENEWNELAKTKNLNLNRYNEGITQFIDKFAIETTQLDFVCTICGQVLPLKQYVQDGSFDNNTQKFVTAYVPLDKPLEEIKEYSKYKLIIRYLDALVSRVSLITGTNMLVGPTTPVKQKRKALVKNIIDLILKHNYVNLRKNEKDEERLDFFSKRFNIDKDLDSVYFFELDDRILDFNDPASSTSTSINRLKYNNMLLYFILVFITELNGPQIAMMYSDKIANIYVFEKYGPKLFGDLRLKRNINDMETIPITKYPVLCYLIYLVSYFLIKYKLWSIPADKSKPTQFNPYYIKIIVNSFVDLFNSISMDAGKNTNDYIYLLTSSKLYTHLNSTFKNNEIIKILERNHIKYSGKPSAEAEIAVPPEEPIPTFSIENPFEFKPRTRKIPTFKISDGVIFDRPDKLVYDDIPTLTDLSNCIDGSYNKWRTKNTEIISIDCIVDGRTITGTDITGTEDRTIEVYYFNLNKIANRRCLTGTLHDFVGKDGQFVCSICNRKENQSYTDEELDQLALNLSKIDNERISRVLEASLNQAKRNQQEEEYSQEIFTELISSYQKDFGDKMYGQNVVQVDKLIDVIGALIGFSSNIDIDKYPVYLKDNVYIIDHTYNGSVLSEPIIMLQKDNRIQFREDHSYFKTDVYYYTDNRAQVDVYYHAITFQLLGYKEKHKDYVKSTISNAYLKISPSIKNRLLTIGYETQYIDIGDIFDKNRKIYTDLNQNYFKILDGLIRNHIYKTKSIVDKIASIIYKVKNYQPPVETDEPQFVLNTTTTLERLVSKYAELLPVFNIGANNDIFEAWNELRGSFVYEPINWSETNVRSTGNMFVNSNLINFYDASSNMIMYYAVNEMIVIIRSNPDKITQTNIAQMYIDIIVYIYSIYNNDPYRNLLELKRFGYILNGSDVMVDMLKKGQGLMQSQEIEENLDDERPDLLDTTELTEDQQEEMEDLKEEAESLDVEGDYYAEEDEDYAQEGDYNE